MYQAKASGGDRYAFFDKGLRARAVARLEIEQALRRAFERDELRVHFQPELSLVDGRVTGVEALVRWQHPERGLLGPGRFLPVAEETGLIIPIGNWVLAEAHRLAVEWADRGLTPPRVWVNASVRQLLHPDFLRTISETLARSDPRVSLGIEITEDTHVSDPRATSMTSELDRLGVQVAIDDFGTGYSSLSYLNRLHVHCLKVDRSFIGGLGRSPEDTAVTTAVVGLGHALDLDVIAEGVETPEQAAILCNLGCRGAQGYYFARPLDAGAAARFLATAPLR
jgi:EAL domain-containing protein (putative c-di-GMP-specific phosphodiesterase class I)